MTGKSMIDCPICGPVSAKRVPTAEVRAHDGASVRLKNYTPKPTWECPKCESWAGADRLVGAAKLATAADKLSAALAKASRTPATDQGRQVEPSPKYGELAEALERFVATPRGAALAKSVGAVDLRKFQSETRH